MIPADTKNDTLHALLARRILLLDGGFGTMVQGYGLQEEAYRGERFRSWEVQLKGCNDLLVLTRPQVIAEIHEAYLKAGADIITTDTFNANRISSVDYKLEDYVYEMNRAAASLARGVADRYTMLNPGKPRFVAGSIGPTNRTASISPDNLLGVFQDNQKENKIFLTIFAKKNGNIYGANKFCSYRYRFERSASAYKRNIQRRNGERIKKDIYRQSTFTVRPGHLHIRQNIERQNRTIVTAHYCFQTNDASIQGRQLQGLCHFGYAGSLERKRNNPLHFKTNRNKYRYHKRKRRSTNRI